MFSEIYLSDLFGKNFDMGGGKFDHKVLCDNACN